MRSRSSKALKIFLVCYITTSELFRSVYNDRFDRLEKCFSVIFEPRGRFRRLLSPSFQNFEAAAAFEMSVCAAFCPSNILHYYR